MGVPTAIVGYFTVYDGAGNDTVDASGVSNGTGIAFFANSGNDTFKGGTGNDEFFGPGDLTSADTVVGGAGSDVLTFGSAGTVASSAFTHVSGIEALMLNGGGNNVTLADTLVAGSDVGYFVVYDGAGNDTVDAHDVTNGKGIAFFGVGGTDTFKGGSGNDVFYMPSVDTIDGNGGLDRIILSTPGQELDLTANIADFRNVEVISLESSAGATLRLTNTDIPQINAAGNSLYVLGGSDDQVIVGGGTWNVVSTDVQNFAVSPTAHFVHYNNPMSGSDLYVDNTITFPIELAMLG